MNQEIDQKKEQLRSAQAELEELEHQISSFESLLDTRLGNLLDQLSELNADTSDLDGKLRQIREKRLFGEDLIKYLDGAPKPTRPPNLSDLPPIDLLGRNLNNTSASSATGKTETQIPDIKKVYRRLARRYHPDLARSDADRLMSNEQMADINRLYQNGDLPALMQLAGMGIPYGIEIPQVRPNFLHNESLTEMEQVEFKLKTIRQEITRLSHLPIVKLSLDVKLARHQRRDLLAEMAVDLQCKVARKIAERDYLRSQIKASGYSEAVDIDQA